MTKVATTTLGNLIEIPKNFLETSFYLRNRAPKYGPEETIEVWAVFDFLVYRENFKRRLSDDRDKYERLMLHYQAQLPVDEDRLRWMAQRGLKHSVDLMSFARRLCRPEFRDL